MTARVIEFANQIIDETEARVKKEIEERVEIETKYKIAGKLIKDGINPSIIASSLNLSDFDMAIILPPVRLKNLH